MAVTRIVVMGVAGAGKTTVGERVAERLGATYADADDLHPEANVAKMAAGLPLDDADRAPWLRRTCERLVEDESVVVSCSALKRRYRDVLRGAGGVTFVFLDIDPNVVRGRVAERKDHFMKAEMVDGQFEALERPAADETDVLVVSADRSVGEIVDSIVRAMLHRTAG